MMSRATAWLLTLSLILGTSGHALGQATIPAQPPPAGTPSAPPEIIEPAPQPPPPPAEAPTATEKLQQSDGVIKPPQGVDPGIVKPPPPDADAAKMPVIPPPPAPPPAN